jgi:DNA-directed RNA polymerase subunit alpha
MEITLPKKPKVTKKEGNFAIIEIEDLYPGYGMTIGNALRRVLLSSLPGAAVTFVKIKNVSHEFSTIPGVVENVVALLLNIKQLRFKLHTNEPQTVKINVSREGEVTGKDIKTPSQVEVINKNLVIATLSDKKTEFEIEMIVEKGLGYVPAEDSKKEKLEVGLIAVDSIFTPIRKINYDVKDMRVGDKTNFNKVKVSIETDGSIDPEDAFYYAIDLLVGQFSQLKKDNIENAEEIVAEIEGSEKEEKEKPKKDDTGKIKIADFDVSGRTISVLENSSIKTVAGLIKKSESDILELEGMGEKGLSEIKEALGSLGLSLKEDK